MKCLSSAQIQAVADGQASRVEQEHAQACAECNARVSERQRQGGVLRTVSEGVTRLRSQPVSSPWRPAAWGTAAMAAATLVVIVFVAPLLKEDRGAVSAAEVLAASATRLSQAVASGVEILEYELALDGVPKDLMPDHANGVYRIRQVIDHGTPGRFRFASYSPDGQPFTSIAQDPASSRRVMLINVEGQPYRFEVGIPANVGPSIAEMERLHMQATIAMMQASGDQLLEVVKTADGDQYRIAVPRVQTPIASPVWDLSEAQVVVDASDYRINELTVKGTFLKQSYSVHYRLISRLVAASVSADTFVVPAQPGEIVISGQGSVIPARDAMVLALRELTRLKRAQ